MRISDWSSDVCSSDLVSAWTVAPLVAHVGAEGEVEDLARDRLAEAVLGPVVLDLVVVEDHVGRHPAEQPAHVAGAEGGVVALLEFLEGVGEPQRDRKSVGKGKNV